MRIWLTAATSIILATGGVMNANLADRQWSEPKDLGPLLENISIQHCVIGEEDGEPAAYFTVAGEPAVFNVVGLEDYRLIDSFSLEGADRAWSHAVASDGSVYIAGVGSGASGHLYRYRPGAGEVEDLGAPVRGHKFIWALAADERGGVFGGTWEGGHVFHFDADTGEYRDFGRIDPEEDYIRSIAFHNGTVYAGSGARNGRVWRIDPKSGERSRIELPVREEYADEIDNMRSAYHLAVAGDHLFAFFAASRVMLAYDLRDDKWWEETFTGVRGPVSGISSPDQTRFYFVSRSDGFVEIDLETRKSRAVERFDGAFRGGGWVRFRDEESFPDKVLVTVHGSGGVDWYDFESGESGSLPSLAQGTPTPIHALEMGPDGALYASGYMGSSGARFDPATREIETFGVGQAESIASTDKTVYWGVYPGARIYAQSAGKGELPSPRRAFEIGHHQDRPYVMTTGGGKLFIGTIPDYGRLGGVLAVRDLGEEGSGTGDVRVYPDIVDKQSIVGLVRHTSGLLFGSTSVSGGLGIETEAEKARLFVWDVDNEKKIHEWSPELPGAEKAPMISGLSLGPDDNVWGAMNGVVFVIDPESFQIVRYRNVYPDVTRYGRWRPVHLRWGSDGLLYSDIAGRITVIDPETLESLDLGVRSGLMALDREDNLYYVRGSRLMMISAKNNNEE